MLPPRVGYLARGIRGGLKELASGPRSVGVAGEGEDLGVVDEAVDHCAGDDDVVGEDPAPSPDLHIRRHEDRALLVAGRDELKE